MSLVRSSAPPLPEGQRHPPQPQGKDGPPKQSDQLDGELRPLIEQIAIALRKAKANGPTDTSAVAAVPPNAATAFASMQTASPQTQAAVADLHAKLVEARKLNDDDASKWKEKGNIAYSERRFAEAVDLYTRSLMYVSSSDLAAIIITNRAAVLFQMRMPLAAAKDCTEALRLSPGYSKAIERRGRCLELLGETDALVADQHALQEAKKLCSDSAAASEIAPLLVCGTCAVARLSREAENETCAELVDSLPSTEKPTAATLVQEPLASVGAVRLSQEGLIATQSIKPGTSIVVETPFAAVLTWDAMLRGCSATYKITPNLYPSDDYRRLGLRSRGLFSGQDAAAAFWRTHGEEEAKNVFWLVCPIDTLLAHRCLRRAAGAVPGSTKLMSKFEEGSLECSRNGLGSEYLETFSSWSMEVDVAATVGGYETAAACAGIAFGAVEPRQLPALVNTQRRLLVHSTCIEVLDRVAMNGEGMLRQQQQQHAVSRLRVGKALYMIAASLRHSCSPSLSSTVLGAPYQAGAELHLRVLIPLTEGDVLTVAKGGISKVTHHSVQSRRRELRGRYGIGCSCFECENNVDEAVGPEQQQQYFDAADRYQKGRRLIREGNVQDGVAVLQQSLDMVMRDICPPPRPLQPMVPKTHDAIAMGFQMLGDRRRCAQHAEMAALAAEKIHGRLSPDLPREYLKLAVLFSALSRDASQDENGCRGAGDKAVDYAQEASELMRLHYPPSKSLEAELALARVAPY